MKYAEKGIIFNINIQTYQAQKCFFCGDYMVPNKKSLVYVDKSERGEWIEKYGCYKYYSGSIGKKQICEECLSNLIDLVCEL